MLLLEGQVRVCTRHAIAMVVGGIFAPKLERSESLETPAHPKKTSHHHHNQQNGADDGKDDRKLPTKTSQANEGAADRLSF